MKPAGLLLVGLLATTSGTVSANAITFYDMDATILPETQQLDVALRLDYVSPSKEVDSIEFLLHQGLTIESLAGPTIEGFTYREADFAKYPFTPEARAVSLDLKQPLLAGETLHIEMKYAGSIGIVGEWETNRITGDWVELGLYAPWFPYNPGLTEIGFNIALSIDESYQVTANGRTEKSDGLWQIQSDISSNDIVLAASETTKSRDLKDDGVSFALHWATELQDPTVDDILNQGMRIMQRYGAWFGENTSAHGSVLISPREKGGGYARKNLIVLSAITDQDYFAKKNRHIRYLAHELAHLWWFRAKSNAWHDWLNESLAEYSAQMIVRDLLGKEEFTRRMAAKRERITGLPPIQGLDRNSEAAYSVLYDKGPVLLQELEGRMGQAEFGEFLNAVFQSGVASTEQFISLLRNEGGQDLADYFSTQLDK